MNKKKVYEKPVMRVYEIKQRARLLQASATMDVYYYQQDI